MSGCNKMTDRKKIARIIDANLNRAREGSRVLEEVARFLDDNSVHAKQIKDLRHNIVTVVNGFGLDYAELLDARDSETDVGRMLQGKLEDERINLNDIIAANFSRIEEALRSIEEFGKLLDATVAREIKDIRYKVYTLEKEFQNELKE